MTARPKTPLREEDGHTVITVQRCCNGCGFSLGDATEAELELAVDGGELPDVRAECPKCTLLGPAVAAAVDAVMKQRGIKSEGSRIWTEALVRTALEAAAPVLAEAVARAIDAHRDAHGPHPATPVIRRAWRRHLTIASQVASLTFTTREELLQQAAAAIERGDYMACYDNRTEQENQEI